MLIYIYHIFNVLRRAFSRETSWIIFCSVIVGMIGCSEMCGVSSLCRFWGLNENGYLSLLHFFHSSSWKMETLLNSWLTFVLSENVTIEENGRLITIADHTLVPKDGRYMPGVVSLHQESETQSKPSYFRGHCWGAIGLLVGSMKTSFCLPIMAKLHQGYAHLSHGEQADNLAERPVQMALHFSLEHHRPVILILDAFFSVSSVFERANSVWDIRIKQPLVNIITKAKKGYVAYSQPPKGKRRNSKNDESRVKLNDIFTSAPLLDPEKYQFQKAMCLVYGRLEEVSYLAMNLYWGAQDRLIRFIWVKNSLGWMILMCSDLQQEPLRAIELYCTRMRIEMMFDRFKNLLKSFNYRFWTRALPRHSRRPKKNADLKKPQTEKELTRVINCWNAYENFVSLGCIALGILQLVALKYPEEVLMGFQSFLRTRSQTSPSERVAKEVLSIRFQNDLGKVNHNATLGMIHDYHAKAGFLWTPFDSKSELLCSVEGIFDNPENDLHQPLAA